MRSVLKATLIVGICLMLFWLAAASWAQEPTPVPTSDDQPPCEVGQLCETGNGDHPTFGTTKKGHVNDPPGAFSRSLITIGIIAVLLGAYIYFAFTGTRPPFLGRKRQRAES